MDLRYHVVSFIAIFLALAAGVMLGGTQFNAQKYESMLHRIEEQQAQLRQENDDTRRESDRLRAALAHRDAALRELVPRLVAGRVAAGTRVAVAWCGEWESRAFWGDLESLLRAAGATIAVRLTVPDHLRELPPDLRQRAIAYFGGTMTPGSRETLRWFVRGLLSGGYGQLLREVAAAAGIEVEGDLSSGATCLLLLSSVRTPERQQRAAAGELPEVYLADAALEFQGRVVAAEPEEQEESFVRVLGRRGVPTVDNVETPLGQLSVALAIGGQSGQFGAKVGATAPFPPLPHP